jgi:hypothetical protein
MAIATSLSLPPGAMFSIMFTKHRILNYRRRQEGFSALHCNRRSDRLRGASAWYACQLRCYSHAILQRTEEDRGGLRAHQPAAAGAADVGAKGLQVDLVYVY